MSNRIWTGLFVHMLPLPRYIVVVFRIEYFPYSPLCGGSNQASFRTTRPSTARPPSGAALAPITFAEPIWCIDDRHTLKKLPAGGNGTEVVDFLKCIHSYNCLCTVFPHDFSYEEDIRH